MKCSWSLLPSLFILGICVGHGDISTTKRLLVLIPGSISVFAVQTPDGRVEIQTEGPTRASALISVPLRIELNNERSGQLVFQQGYDLIETTGTGSFHGKGTLKAGGARFVFDDSWLVSGTGLMLTRSVRVSGHAAGGFMSAFTYRTAKPWTRQEVNIFVPGMIYGDTEHIPADALGGRNVYQQMHGIVRIREDRMPAPLFGVHFADRSSVTLINAHPEAASTLADSNDSGEWNDVSTIVDARFRFGALGEDESGGWDTTSTVAEAQHLTETRSSRSPLIGYWFPGTEGEMSYGQNAHDVWRRRFHPVEDGFLQRYQLRVELVNDSSFPAYMSSAWRTAWHLLNPAVVTVPIAVARQSIIEMLAHNVVQGKGGTGLPFFMDAARGDLIPEARNARMGFLGRNLQAADMFLYEAQHHPSRGGEKLQVLATAILDSFARLNMAPPEAEGFWLDSGTPLSGDIFLRSPSEDLYYMLSAWKREHNAGREHPAWHQRPQEFGDWLLKQQGADGGLPRAWARNSDRVVIASTLGSYNAIPLLVALWEHTRDKRYLEAATRAGELCWNQGQKKGNFVGGTEDNPNVIDKESGTLSMNAYLLLFEATKQAVWLERAKAAGDFAESWIYIWNIDMPSDATDEELPWKKGIPTSGLQLIAAGHSGADEYMSGEVANYAKLYRYTKDPHYLDVARVLLNNTKSMLGLPGRTFDLAGPGWQQESFDLSMPRNFMQHRVWLPWISVAQLSGIVQLEEFDGELYQRLTNPE